MTLWNKNMGFTLVELLVAIAVSGVIMTSVYAAFQSQQKSYTVQEEVAALQQNLRTAIYYMSNQIREAGCNPKSIKGANAPRIITANVDAINFTADVRGNDFGTEPDGLTSGPYENITYSLYTSNNIQKLGVKSTANATNQPVIENVDALNFVYLKGDGSVATNIGDIRSVKVSIVVRASRTDPQYTDVISYTNEPNGQGDLILAAQNDHFRRRQQTIRIVCRNLGL